MCNNLRLHGQVSSIWLTSWDIETSNHEIILLFSILWKKCIVQNLALFMDIDHAHFSCSGDVTFTESICYISCIHFYARFMLESFCSHFVSFFYSFLAFLLAWVLVLCVGIDKGKMIQSLTCVLKHFVNIWV